jgi:hypothetical protein
MRSIMPGDMWTWCYAHEAQGTLSGAGDRAVPAGTRS